MTKNTEARYVLTSEGPLWADKQTWTTHTVHGVFSGPRDPRVDEEIEGVTGSKPRWEAAEHAESGGVSLWFFQEEDLTWLLTLV